MQQSQFYFSTVASIRAPSLSTFSPIRGYTLTSLGASIFNPRQNFKAYYTRGPLSRLISGDVMRSVSLASEDSDTSFTAQWRLLYVSRFTRFRYTRRFMPLYSEIQFILRILSIKGVLENSRRTCHRTSWSSR
jgi:hypothetical protein